MADVVRVIEVRHAFLVREVLRHVVAVWIVPVVDVVVGDLLVAVVVKVAVKRVDGQLLVRGISPYKSVRLTYQKTP